MFATLEAKVLGSIALVAILLGAFGVYTLHERVVGKDEELAAMVKSTSKLKADTAKQTADLQARATLAEQAYDKEHNAVANLPPVQPVRLCINAGSSAKLPAAGTQVSGNGKAGAGPGAIQQVPTGNPERAGPDISGMLNAFAASADQISSTLREYQKRE